MNIKIGLVERATDNNVSFMEVQKMAKKKKAKKAAKKKAKKKK